MKSPHLFIDESIRGRTYLLGVAVVPVNRLAAARTLLRALCLPGERRVHFQAESNTRRRALISELVAGGISADLYLAQGPAGQARAACVRAMTIDACKRGAHRVAIESRGETGDRADRLTISSTLRAIGVGTFDGPFYEHVQSHEDPLLGIADATAWAYGAGGDWRRRIQGVINQVIQVEN
ncbi:hypothetical protein UO65_1806 [Actinokineospora spheciospongiae]|uniref:DUF3800 domain-containing protein n=1 Tax=Actinokineospora spheciospongiae TaxID=909613 RepID=W7IRC6_9PSEU|nr:hypothetical protein [Actinokineospora spheciospongiae]EWC62858.1 hypothetical protein UO65_1806 [Actinokineospora spheciospongiae]